MLSDLLNSDNPPAIDPEPKILSPDSDDTGAVLDALGSETSRELYAALLSEPRTASELAATVDTSIQTVSYHIDNLQEADLVEPGTTRYSDRGREMTVWVPVSRGILVTDNPDTDRLRRRVASVLGLAIGAATIDVGVAVLAQRVLRRSTRLAPASLPAGSSPHADLLAWVLSAAATVDLGIGLFLGGLAVLAVWWNRG
ncbi:ArsR/SmtB family transcription factor [Halonotius pteroides]|uniref:ArsR family transcriptional regulator n=1 Tax=Halonotius pteroides TaxID=268735 RepID=A0A3A6QAV1_9EURY|nr:helix-turn-helix domain-containing protein [Halonotius pteroides]RJX47543.1 ArsR family transcriptional regulator [Halonotius pteroides]